MLHVPTTQVALFTAASAPAESSPELRCLLFSICFAATTSLSPEEVRNVVAKDKVAALNQYKLGLERSLTEASFYETPTLLTLEALTLFLVCSGLVCLRDASSLLRLTNGTFSHARE